MAPGQVRAAVAAVKAWIPRYTRVTVARRFVIHGCEWVPVTGVIGTEPCSSDWGIDREVLQVDLSDPNHERDMCSQDREEASVTHEAEGTNLRRMVAELQARLDRSERTHLTLLPMPVHEIATCLR